ncbi:hypothetical protein ACEPAG_9483 [Sanghuangporus baumii]
MAKAYLHSDAIVQESDEESVQETETSITNTQVTAATARDHISTQVTAAKPVDDSPAIELSFILELFSFSEMQKRAKEHASKSTRFTLSSDEPFNTFKAQLLAKISDLLKPAILQFEDYGVTYMIKWKQKMMSLQNEDDYYFLLSLQSFSDIHVTVTQKRKPATKNVQQVKRRERDGSDSSEPSSGEDSDEPPMQKKRKSDNAKTKKVRKVGDISVRR